MCVDDRTPHFQCFSERLRTFGNWPRNQTPESLASVGFFRNKEGVDGVQCFDCGIRIYDWKPNDDPLSEHLRLSSNCKFANRLKHFNTAQELFEQVVKLFEEVTISGGVDVAGNSSGGAANKKDCIYCHK